LDDVRFATHRAAWSSNEIGPAVHPGEADLEAAPR
jgi:hypothetical protein